MAHRIARADGVFTDAATWGEVDSTSLLDNYSQQSALTTSYVESQVFAPGAITVDGVAVYVAARAGSPGTDTMTVRLAQAGVTVTDTEITINVSDIQANLAGALNGWYFFKFAAPVLLVAATDYTLSAKVSTNSAVTLFRNGTGGNWARMLRTTTTGAPAAGENLHILGEWTAPGIKTNRTVTMDNTTSTAFGTTASGLDFVFSIGKGGTLLWPDTAATNLRLRISGYVAVWPGGTLSIGTVGNPIPRSSTALFEVVATGAFGPGINCWGTFIAQGQSRTSGKNIVRCQLNTDEAAAQTVLGVDTDTGWLAGDDIAIASTTQLPGEAETRTLDVNAGASTLTVTSGLTNAHSGTSPIQAEVVLLTRNVRIESSTSAQMMYLAMFEGSTGDFDWVAFRYFGSNTHPDNAGIVVKTAVSFAMSYCSLRDFGHYGLTFPGSVNYDHISVDHLTAWKVGNQAAGEYAISLAATTGSDITLDEIDIVSGVNSQNGGFLTVVPFQANIRNFRGNSGGAGAGTAAVVVGDSSSATTADDVQSGTWENWNIHSFNGTGGGVQFWGGAIKITNLKIWRVTAGGLVIRGGDVLVDGATLFGNGNGFNPSWNIDVGTNVGMTAPRLTVKNGVIADDTTYPVVLGVLILNGTSPILRFENTTFGVVSGILGNHSGSIAFGTQNKFVDLTLVNCNLADPTEFFDESYLIGHSAIRVQRSDQATGVHFTRYSRLGTVSRETSVFRTAAPSEKLAPAGATAQIPLETQRRLVPIRSGETKTITVYVRKNGSYTGVAPKLVLRSNPAVGIDSDTVLATHSAGADTWQQLSGTTPAAEEDGVVAVSVEVTGSAGLVYVDDWAAS